MVRSQDNQFQSEPTKELSLAERLKNSVLYKFGLIDDEYLSKGLTKHISDTFDSLLRLLDRRKFPENNFIIQENILTKEDFQTSVAKPAGNAVDLGLLMYFIKPNEKLTEGTKLLVEKKFLNKETLWKKFLFPKSFYARAMLTTHFDWVFFVNSGVAKPENIFDTHEGFDAVEVRALQNDLMGSHKTKRYPLNHAAHPLVHRLRGQENTDKSSQQVEAVLGPTGKGSVLEDLQKVFDHYLRTTAMFKKLSLRDKIPPGKRNSQRAKNISSVNECQTRKLQEKNPNWKPYRGYDPQKRHFDIYARYESWGMMDPFQLAIISKAAEWYIMGGRSNLFNSVRVLPTRYDQNDDSHIPFVAVAACKGATLMRVQGDAFRESVVGANRSYLMHASSTEATDFHSIPIIGLANFQDSNKKPSKEGDFVVFDADFDPLNGERWNNVPSNRPNVNGDIPGLINEALKTMVAVEDMEIARAEEYEAAEAMPKAA